MTAPDVVTEMFAAYRTSLDSLEGKLGNAFSDAVDLLEGMSGKVVVCGMGKSGLVGAKITATLTSLERRLYFCIPQKPCMAIWVLCARGCDHPDFQFW